MNLRPKEPGLAVFALSFAGSALLVAPFSTWHMPVVFGTLAILMGIASYTRS